MLCFWLVIRYFNPTQLKTPSIVACVDSNSCVCGEQNTSPLKSGSNSGSNSHCVTLLAVVVVFWDCDDFSFVVLLWPYLSFNTIRNFNIEKQFRRKELWHKCQTQAMQSVRTEGENERSESKDRTWNTALFSFYLPQRQFHIFALERHFL